MSSEQHNPQILKPDANGEFHIIGGGITGLMAAKEALDRGVPPEKIHIHEAANRLGGPIKNVMIGDQAENNAAEFIDADNFKMVTTATEIGAQLYQRTDQGVERFCDSKGKIIENFLEQYAPIAKRVMEIRD